MHKLQEHILYELTLRSPRRYSELKPQRVEGNVFMYHLRTVMKSGLVVKVPEGYGLTTAGMQYADTLSVETKAPRAQPKIVTQIVCQNGDGEWLLYRRNRAPFTGCVGFPYGKVHLGEKVVEAAARELLEKTGLVADVEYAGDLYVTVTQKDVLVSHMLAHVFRGTVTGGELKDETEYGHCFWGKVEEGEQYFPGFLDELAVLERGDKRFFEEFLVEV